MVRPRKDQQIDISARAVEQTICLLDEKGAEAITLAEVAAAVGCRAPALYAYFANKNALLRAVHDEGFRILLKDKLAIAAKNSESPFNQLREGGVVYLCFAFERPGLYQLMFSPPRDAGLENPFESDLGMQCLAVLQSAIVSCQKEGYLPQANPAQMAFVLWSAIHGAVSLILQGRTPARTGQDELATATTVLDSLMSFIQLTQPATRDSN